jgi:outer membrane lipoprotein SlyB
MRVYPEHHDQEVDKFVGTCILAGAGFGLVLGILFGIAFNQMACVVIGVVCGAIMGIAIEESNKNFKEYRSS